MRIGNLEPNYRGEQRKHYFEDPKYRKWSDIETAMDNDNYGEYRERAFIRLYLDCDSRDNQESLSKIHEVMSNGENHPINWSAFYTYFDKRSNDPHNPYAWEMGEKMFPRLDDSPTVKELLDQYRDTLL